MNKPKIAILFGGCSEEYDISLQSAASVIRNIDGNKYDIINIGISRHGVWHRYYGPADLIESGAWESYYKCPVAFISPSRDVHGIVEFTSMGTCCERIDAAFPVLHGINGEDGTVQGLLEMAGIPVIGCGMLSSAICMDKDVAHSLVKSAGVSTTPSIVVRKNDDMHDIVLKASKLIYPLFVKPARSGSSIGICKVERETGLASAVSSAFEHDTKVVIEQAVNGVEVGCAVLGGCSEPITGAVDEIDLISGFLDYEEKYGARTATIRVPARISESLEERIKQTAKLIYRTLECSGFARVDMFLAEDGEIVFNEVNTIPGLTCKSRYARMLEAAGISFKTFINILLDGWYKNERYSYEPEVCIQR